MADTLSDRIGELIRSVNEYLSVAPVYARTLAIDSPAADQYGKELSSRLFALERLALVGGQQIAADLAVAGLDATPALAVVTCLGRGIDAPELLAPQWLRLETELRGLALAADAPATVKEPMTTPPADEPPKLPLKDSRGRPKGKTAIVAAKIVDKGEDNRPRKELHRDYKAKLDPGTTADGLGRAIRRERNSRKQNRHNSAK